MRVGKKSTVVEAKKTRSCVVLLEKVQPPVKRLLKVAKKGTISGKKTALYQAKQLRDAIKESLLDDDTPIKSTTNLSKARPIPKETMSAKSTKKNKSVVQDYEATPTIAAGRSRRAIKPNPKYASEDMVTPKQIRNVVGISASSNKKGSLERERKQSSSSEDLYNKSIDIDDDEDDDDVIEYNNLDNIINNAYKAQKKTSDSDFLEDFDETPPSKKRRGRPKKVDSLSRDLTRPVKNVGLVLPPKVSLPQRQSLPLKTSLTTKSGLTAKQSLTPKPGLITKSGALPTKLGLAPKLSLTPKPGSAKSTPSQLQQLRKTISSNPNLNRSNDAQQTIRRKLVIDQEGANEIARKRFLLNSNIARYKQDIPKSEKKDITAKNFTDTTKRKLPTQAINGKVISMDKTDKSPSPMQDKRKTITEKPTKAAILSNNNNNNSAKSVASLPAASNKISSTKTNATKRKRSVSPVQKFTTTKQTTKSTTNAGDKADQKTTEASPSSTNEDFEIMPTFTIVNINDIINKKGDVLISQAANKLKKKEAAKPSKPEIFSDLDDMEDIDDLDDLDEDITEDDINELLKPMADPHKSSNRHKSNHTKILTVKPEAERSKNQSPRTPYQSKRTAQQILNHNKINKSAANSKSTPAKPKNKTILNQPEKPAPRILNSMVARKTQPVKPMIANLEDSADDSATLSFDEDDLEKDTSNEKQEKAKTVVRKLKITSQTKENQPTFDDSNQFNKETMISKYQTNEEKNDTGAGKKVMISRHGNKIIKKITCFETWYVINMQNEHINQTVRNLLEFPLIRLANVSQELHLPSDLWSSKVTLYELSATSLAKAPLISFTGDLKEHNIAEEDRHKYQPSCVMFRRMVNDRAQSRLPFDRAVIFKNKTFFINIEGKNVRLLGAPGTVRSAEEVEILLEVVDSLTLQNSLVEATITA